MLLELRDRTLSCGMTILREFIRLLSSFFSPNEVSFSVEGYLCIARCVFRN